ncbi:hypothetical protein DXG01_006909 [Tephrocybe rancida]|nr:hypothetical protein DXG01_006909 [Tephrocybe rancida]
MYPQQWDPYRRYYAQPNPDVYIPPPTAGYGYRQEPPRSWWRSPYRAVANLPRTIGHFSNKYPTLYFLLAADSTRLQWDVRRPPTDIHASTFFSSRHIAAMQTATRKFRIISKAFPWTIDIDLPVTITCEMVWDAIYQGLQEPIADSEWGLILNIKKQRDVVERAAAKRREANKDDDKPLRRIDYLGETTMFKGLDRDEDFAKMRLLPVCSDVVKKPKLDQHRSRCHGGFDCIDCSTTFHTPADYKGHTQCISEAEKYQKSLYKGPKTVAPAPRNNYPPQPPAPTPQWGSSGRGGFGGRGRGGRGGWGQVRTSATGANDTPLGTPTPPVGASPAPSTPQPVAIQAPVKAPQPAPVPEKAAPSTSGEKKKDKKRKAEDISDETTSKKAKVVEDSPMDSTSASPIKVKKDKKDKGKKKESSEDVEMSAPVEGTKKKSKKDKKEKKGDTEDAEEGRKSKKEKKEKAGDAEALAAVDGESSEKSKKKKRKQEGEAGGNKGEDAAQSPGKKEKKKKEKKEKEKGEKERKRASSVSVQ